MQEQQQLTTQEQRETYWKTLSTVNEWVRFLDTKATALLAAAAGLAVLGATLLKDNANLFQHHGWLWLPALLSIVALVGALGTCLYVIAPTLFPQKAPVSTLFDLIQAPSVVVGKGDSLLYFEHIARQHKDTYREASKALFTDSEKLGEHLAEQIHANSIVARDKAHYIGRVVQLIVWAVVLGAITALCGGFAK